MESQPELTFELAGRTAAPPGRGSGGEHREIKIRRCLPAGRIFAAANAFHCIPLRSYIAPDPAKASLCQLLGNYKLRLDANKQEKGASHEGISMGAAVRRGHGRHCGAARRE